MVKKMRVFEAVCPVTDQTVSNENQCRDCKIGLWYACPIKQEVEELEEVEEKALT